MAAHRWGQAWIEVTANRPLICERLNQGYPIRRIYEELKIDGLVTVARSNFHDAVAKLKAETKKASLSVPLHASKLSRLSKETSVPASQPEPASPHAETGVVSADGVSLASKFAISFGNAEFSHNAVASSVRGKPLAIRGKATNQPKEQDDNGS